MNAWLVTLDGYMAAGDVSGLLSALEARPLEPTAHERVELLRLKVVLLPPLLHTALLERTLNDDDMRRLVRLLVNSELRIDDAALAATLQEVLDEAIAAGVDLAARPSAHDAAVRERYTPEDCLPEAETAMVVQRVVIASAFGLKRSLWGTRFAVGRNLCRSRQEREFLRAVRAFFPTYRAYPNMPLSGFVDLTALAALVGREEQRYGKGAVVDVLLCTDDEDPVAVIELDSVYHDTQEAHARDAMKNALLQAAGIPLVRIRAAATATVAADDFYALLKAKEGELRELRPHHLSPRSHEHWVPTEVLSRTRLVPAAAS